MLEDTINLYHLFKSLRFESWTFNQKINFRKWSQIWNKRKLRIPHAFWNFDQFQYFFKMAKLKRKSQQKLQFRAKSWFRSEFHIVWPDHVFGRNHNFGRKFRAYRKGVSRVALHYSSNVGSSYDLECFLIEVVWEGPWK